MSLALTERQTREIEAFCEIARENGAWVSLRELIGLAGIEASEGELATVFDSHSRLKSRFLLESGFVLERSSLAAGGTQQAVEEERGRRDRARANLRMARRFARNLAGGTVILSVSGGNAYLSAGEDEDIDFFCVTKTDGMWPFILRALVLARLHRLANREVPELCFSCTMDERRARQEFKAKQDPIFARDALTAKVIRGRAAYHSLLKDAVWMRSYFPSFYGLRLHETAPEPGADAERSSRTGSALLNSFLYCTLGSLLKVKSWALNRRLTKAGRHSSIFETRLSKGYYVFESNRYRKLRRMYGEIAEG